MPPTNIFSFLQSRQYGGHRPRLRGVQLTMLRMQPQWSFPDALPDSSKVVKDVVLLSHNVFCLITSHGRADAFSVDNVGHPQLKWLTDLRIFGEERVKMAIHLKASQVLLVIFSVAGDQPRGTLYVRAIDIPAALRGEVKVRSCGELASIAVPVGGFVEVDEQNQNIVLFDGAVLRCWGAQHFERRIMLGPWTPDDAPNVRFTLGYMALLCLTDDGGVEIKLHNCQNGHLVSHKEVKLGSAEKAFVFLELCNTIVLLKREGCAVVVVDLLNKYAAHTAVGTENWEPDLFVFLPSRSLVLAYFNNSLEVWRCPRPSEFQCVGKVNLLDFQPGRFCIDEQIACALAVRLPGTSTSVVNEHTRFSDPFFSPEAASPHGAENENKQEMSGGDLVLLDILREGTLRATLHGACEGAGGGGIARMIFDLVEGVLLVVGKEGGLFSYGVLGNSH